MSKKPCLSHQILNPKSNRCVSKTGRIGKTILKLEKDDNSRNINIKWENNSCYIDSLLIALFHRRDSITDEIFFKSSINDYNEPKLKILGEMIKTELKNIYKKISEINDCSEIRKLINKYYKILIKRYPEKKIIGRNENWINSQLDIYDLFNLIRIILNIKEDTLKIKEGSNILYTNLSNQIPIDFIYNENNKKTSLKINSIYPSYSIKYKLTKENKYKDEKGKLQSYYIKKVEILKGNKLFINIYRNLGDTKNNIKIIPCNSIQLKENDFKLYLTSIIIHYGTSVKYGHYICLYKNKFDNKWYEYDDLNGIKYIGSLTNIIKNNEYISNIVGLIYSKV